MHELLNCPPAFQKPLAEFATLSLESIKKNIALCLLLNDDRAARTYTRKLEKYVDCKYPIPVPDRAILVKQLHDLLVKPEFANQYGLMEHWAALFIKMLKHKFDGLSALLTLPWRPLYETMDLLLFKSPRDMPHKSDGHQGDSKGIRLAKVVQKARWYFPAEASQEILAEFEPNLCTFDDMYFRASGYVSLFLPTNNVKETVRWLPLLLPRVNDIDKCSESLVCWFKLFSRAAKHSIGEFDWTPHFPMFFTAFLQALELNVGSQAVPLRSNRAWPAYHSALLCKQRNATDEAAAYFGKFVVHTLSPTSPVLGHLKQLFVAVSTYYHPSNYGGWTSSLGSLLFCLQYFFAKRLGAEDRHPLAKKEYMVRGVVDDQQQTINQFMDIVMPVAMQALYSKSGAMVTQTQMGLLCMAYVCPDRVFTPLTEQFVSSLESRTESHRMMSTLKSLSCMAAPFFNRKLHPEGASTLQVLLELSLPGIDSSNPIKSSATLLWLTYLFQLVPLVDPRTLTAADTDGKHCVNAAMQTTTEDARRVSMFFADWSLAFFDAVVKLFVAGEKLVKKNHADALFSNVIDRTMLAFFFSVSEPIFQSCLERLFKVVTLSHVDDARQQFGHMLGFAAYAFPQQTLAKFIPVFVDKLLKGTKEKEGESVLAESELSWYLYLISQLVKRAGGVDASKTLGLYVDSLLSVYEVCSEHEGKSVRKEANRMIRNLLRGIVQVYPLEFRPFSPSFSAAESSTGNDDYNYDHYQCWGRFFELECKERIRGVDLNLTWHCPSQADVEGDVAKIVKFVLRKPVTVLAGAKQVGEKLSLDSAALVKNCMQVLVVLRGASEVLGGFDGPNVLFATSTDGSAEHDTEEIVATAANTVITTAAHGTVIVKTGAEKNFTGTRCPVEDMFASFVHPTLAANTVVDGAERVSLRTYMATVFHGLAATLLAHKEKHTIVKPWTVLVKCISHVTTVHGVKAFKVSWLRQLNSYYRHNITESYYKAKCMNRPLLVERAYTLHLQRQAQMLVGSHQTGTQEVKNLLSDLCRMSVMDFQQIRSKAQSVLSSTALRFPRSPTVVIAHALAVLADSKSGEEPVLGALDLLCNQYVRAWVTRSWARLRAFVTTLLQHGQQHNEDKIQVRLQATFLVYYVDFLALPLKYPAVSATAEAVAAQTAVGLTSQHVKARNDTIVAQNAWLAEQYLQVVSFFVNILNEELGTEKKDKKDEGKKEGASATHWTYVMMAAVCTVSVTWMQSGQDAVVKALARGLLSDLDPLRRVCLYGLAKILGKHSRSKSGRATPKPVYVSGKSEVEKVIAGLDRTSKAGKGDFVACLSPIGNEQDWVNSQFVDYGYSGWSGDRVRVNAGVSELSAASSSSPVDILGEEMQTETLDWLQNFVETNLTKIVNVLVHNHPTLAAKNVDTGKSKAGAGENIASMVYTQTGLQWPHHRFESRQTSGFDCVHVEFLTGLVEVFPQALLVNTEMLPAQLVRLVADVHETENQCTASELMSAVFRGVKHLPFVYQEAAQKNMGPAVLSALSLCQPGCVELWLSGLSTGLSNQDPRRWAWLAGPLLKSLFDTAVVSTSSSSLLKVDRTADFDSPTGQFKRWAYMQSFLVEWGWRSRPVCDWMLEHMLAESSQWLCHPYKQIREEVGKVLFILMRNYHASHYSSYLAVTDPKHPLARLTAFLTNKVNTSLASATAEDAMETEEKEGEKKEGKEDKTSQYALETVIYAMTTCVAGGDMIFFSDFFVAMLPFVMKSTHHRDLICAAVAKYCSSVCSWVLTDEKTCIAVIEQLKTQVAPSPNYHHRSAYLDFMKVFLPRHTPILGAQMKNICKTITAMLADVHVEVRLLASEVLASVLVSSDIMTTETDYVTKLQRRFMKLAKTPLPAGSTNTPEHATALATRHGGVLGLSAFIVGHPYDLPEHMPALLAFLVANVSDPSTIRGPLRRLFADFRRTHEDQWHEFKDKFTEEQLDAINSVEIAPSYFA